jgi:serine/threonine protein kinase
MSRVYKGYDENLDRYAAVKVISGDFVTTTEEEYTRRFQSEARAIARLRHPNIVGVYQFGRTEGVYYMAQVFLEGRDLRSLLKENADKGRRILPDETLRIARDVTSALDYAHEQGVIHRDVKPSNIMLEKKTGRAIIMDFGLALSIQEGTMGDTFGSAHYIAPEQAVSSAKAVPQSDLYSLGIVLYEMMAGKVPFDDPSVMSVALKHLNELPPPPSLYNPDLPPAVEAIIMRTLDKDPKKRPASGKELVADLEKAFQIQTAPDASAALHVVGTIGSQPTPPAAAISRPTPPPAAPSKTDTGRARLTGRFARRRAEKEQEAALKSPSEDQLQIDDDTLGSLLKSMPDPSEINLVGEGATGIKAADVRASRPTPLPGLLGMAEAAAETKQEEKKRRSRIGLLLPSILALVIVAGGAYFGTRDGGTQTTALPAAEQTGTARALAAVNPTRSPQPTARPTEKPTAAPTVRPTAQPTGQPTGEATVEPTLTQESTAEPTGQPTAPPTEESTAAPTPTVEATDTPEITLAPTDTPSPASTEVAMVIPAVGEPTVRLVYNENEFLLINISGAALDVSRLVFERELADGTKRSFPASSWNRSDIPVKPNRMAADSCYQFLTSSAEEAEPDRQQCPFFLGFFRSSLSRRYFWIADEPGATFTVRLDSSDTPLAVCEIDAGECDFYAGPEGASAPTVTPTPGPTLPSGEPNIRLIYDRSVFVLINISDETLDVSQLVLERELRAGSMRVFLTAEWDEQRGVLGETSALEPGGCYELVTSQGSWIKPPETDCPMFLGWFRSNLAERYFWVSSEPGASFVVRFSDNFTPLATCEIDAGECRFYLPTP